MVFVAILVCSLLAWLGWLVALSVHEVAQASVARACVMAEFSWDGSACVPPTIELHIAKPPEATERNPLLGPGGA
jgi:hypothetical protein